jgi:hypothetical protein
MQVRDIRKRAKSKYEVIDGIKGLRLSQEPRCKSYERGCLVCDFWHFYDTNQRFPTWDEIETLMEIT